MIKFVSDIRQVGGFLRVSLVSSINKTDRHVITEILLKVVLNTINQTKLSHHNNSSSLLDVMYLNFNPMTGLPSQILFLSKFVFWGFNLAVLETFHIHRYKQQWDNGNIPLLFLFLVMKKFDCAYFPFLVLWIRYDTIERCISVLTCLLEAGLEKLNFYVK